MALSRREFLTDVAASLLALRLEPGGVPRAGSGDRLERIGLQLYTVRSEMQKSVEGTLAAVARSGYQEVEFAGYFGKTPKEIRGQLDANGLSSPSSHNGDFQTLRAGWARALEDAAVIGHRYCICASIPRRERATVDGMKRVAALFNSSGETARRAGMRFAYHNHADELAPLDGTTAYDVLLAETDPELVFLQLDLYWMVRGGKDPLAYFAKHPRRCVSVHVKDMGADQQMVDVGAGRLPFARYLAAARRAGVQHYFVEHDDPADPFASIRASHDYLKKLEF